VWWNILLKPPADPAEGPSEGQEADSEPQASEKPETSQRMMSTPDRLEHPDEPDSCVSSAVERDEGAAESQDASAASSG